MNREIIREICQRATASIENWFAKTGTPKPNGAKIAHGVLTCPLRESEAEAIEDAKVCLSCWVALNRPLFPGSFRPCAVNHGKGWRHSWERRMLEIRKVNSNTWMTTKREFWQENEKDTSNAAPGCRLVTPEDWHAIQFRQHLRKAR